MFYILMDWIIMFTEHETKHDLYLITYICLIQVEFGAGDTHGPLFGMKIFRNLTSRW